MTLTEKKNQVLTQTQPKTETKKKKKSRKHRRKYQVHLYTHIRAVCNEVYSPEKRSSPLVRVDAFSDKNLTGGLRDGPAQRTSSDNKGSCCICVDC